jgi:hypothetical protein
VNFPGDFEECRYEFESETFFSAREWPFSLGLLHCRFLKLKVFPNDCLGSVHAIKLVSDFMLYRLHKQMHPS